MPRHYQSGVEHCFIRPDGTAIKELPAKLSGADTVKQLYKNMMLTRSFDARAIELQRTGRLGTYPSSLGQEACAVGIAHAMRPEDVFLPSFREHGTQLMRGVTMEELLLYWSGDERGSDFQEAREDFPNCATVGGHALHATGVAMAFKLRKEARVAVCVFGDGATSKGDVYEAMNFAGVWQLPLVFVVCNNQWAISTSVTKQTAVTNLADKAVAAGFQGRQVDGNDVIAVCDAVSAAIDHARQGDGPCLLECLTYRLGDHTTADDAGRYRDDEEVREWWNKDPLARTRRYLESNGHWQADDEEQLDSRCRDEVSRAVERFLDTPPQDPATMFDFMHEDIPADLRTQREFMLAQFRDSEQGQSNG